MLYRCDQHRKIVKMQYKDPRMASCVQVLKLRLPSKDPGDSIIVAVTTTTTAAAAAVIRT